MIHLYVDKDHDPLYKMCFKTKQGRVIEVEKSIMEAADVRLEQDFRVTGFEVLLIDPHHLHNNKFIGERADAMILDTDGKYYPYGLTTSWVPTRAGGGK